MVAQVRGQRCDPFIKHGPARVEGVRLVSDRSKVANTVWPQPSAARGSGDAHGEVERRIGRRLPMFHGGTEQADVVSSLVLEMARDHPMETRSKVVRELARGSRPDQIVRDLQSFGAERHQAARPERLRRPLEPDRRPSQLSLEVGCGHRPTADGQQREEHRRVWLEVTKACRRRRGVRSTAGDRRHPERGPSGDGPQLRCPIALGSRGK